MMTIADLKEHYLSGARKPVAVIEEIFARIRADGELPSGYRLQTSARPLTGQERRSLASIRRSAVRRKRQHRCSGMPTTAGARRSRTYRRLQLL